jgi:hypothetical protein
MGWPVVAKGEGYKVVQVPVAIQGGPGACYTAQFGKKKISRLVMVCAELDA